MRLFFCSVKNRALFCAFGIPVIFFCAILGAGSYLSRPVKHTVGKLPDHLRGREIEFESASGSKLSGWLIPETMARALSF